MEKRPVEWTGDLDDDCTAIWYQFMLRAEEMDDQVWWWAVYDRDRDGEEVDSSNNHGPGSPKTGKHARQLAEEAARIHLARSRGVNLSYGRRRRD